MASPMTPIKIKECETDVKTNTIMTFSKMFINPLLTKLRLYNVGHISEVFLGSLYIPELQKYHIT